MRTSSTVVTDELKVFVDPANPRSARVNSAHSLVSNDTGGMFGNAYSIQSQTRPVEPFPGAGSVYFPGEFNLVNSEYVHDSVRVGWWNGYNNSSSFTFLTDVGITYDWCIECWIYVIDDGRDYHTIFSTTNGYRGVWLKQYGADGHLHFKINDYSETLVHVASTEAVSFNTWHHIAIRAVKPFEDHAFKRIFMYVDGVEQSNAVDDHNIEEVSNDDYYHYHDLWIGAFSDTTLQQNLHGYISNFRIVKGTTVYGETTGDNRSTIDFEPPLYTLTRITKENPTSTTEENHNLSGVVTEVLTCQGDAIQDVSSYTLDLGNVPQNDYPFSGTVNDGHTDRTPTVEGGAAVATANTENAIDEPFTGAGSITFGGGALDWIKYSAGAYGANPYRTTSNWDDWTFECWLKDEPDHTNHTAYLFQAEDFANTNRRLRISLNYNSGTPHINVYHQQYSVNYNLSQLDNFDAHQWNHLAIVRSKDRLQLFWNGVPNDDTPDFVYFPYTGPTASHGIMIGNRIGNNGAVYSTEDYYRYRGKISQLRFTHDVVYPRNVTFEPPKYVLNNLPRTILLSCQNGQITDNSGPRTLADPNSSDTYSTDDVGRFHTPFWHPTTTLDQSKRNTLSSSGTKHNSFFFTSSQGVTNTDDPQSGYIDLDISNGVPISTGSFGIFPSHLRNFYNPYSITVWFNPSVRFTTNNNSVSGSSVTTNIFDGYYNKSTTGSDGNSRTPADDKNRLRLEYKEGDDLTLYYSASVDNDSSTNYHKHVIANDLSLQRWHCVTIVFTNLGAKCYLNGIDTQTTSTLVGDLETTIGRHENYYPYYIPSIALGQGDVSLLYNDSGRFIGQLGPFMIHDKQLSDTEVMQCFNSHASRYNNK